MRPGEPAGLCGKPRRPGHIAACRGGLRGWGAAGRQVRRGPRRARWSGSLFPVRHSRGPGRQPAAAESPRTGGCVATRPPPGRTRPFPEAGLSYAMQGTKGSEGASLLQSPLLPGLQVQVRNQGHPQPHPHTALSRSLPPRMPLLSGS